MTSRIYQPDCEFPRQQKSQGAQYIYRVFQKNTPVSQNIFEFSFDLFSDDRKLKIIENTDFKYRASFMGNPVSAGSTRV